MELRHLKYFVAVANELHFGRAAEKLQIAQPPLSQQIKALEEELGVLLFERTKRRVALTESGKAFLKRVNKILKDIDQACVEAVSIHRGESGQIKLGFAGLVTFDLLPFLLQTFQERYPRVKVTMHHLTTTEQIEALEENEIDIGILIPPVDSRRIHLDVIREEPFILAINRAHPFGKMNKAIYLSALANNKFIMPPRSAGPGYYDSIISLCHQAGFSPNTSQEAKELQTVVSLVAAGIGVAILPSSIQNIKNDHVTYLPINNTIKIQTCIAYKKDNTSAVIESFLSLIRKSLIEK